MNASNGVRIVEVGPRDGLQFEDQKVSLADKLTFTRMLADAGVRFIEAGSFVSPAAVPQMADSDRLTDILRTEAEAGRYPGVQFSFLTVNRQGAEIAMESGVSRKFGEFAVVVGASDEFCQSNLRIPTMEEAIEKLAAPVIALGQKNGIPTRGYVSTVFEGQKGEDVDPGRVAQGAKRLLDLGAYEVSLGDTTGAGTPDKVHALVNALKAHDVPLERVAMHFHDTHGRAVENALVAHNMGIDSFDSAAGGLGGCRYAKSKVGNAATEDYVRMFEDGVRVSTGIRMQSLLLASRFILNKVGKESPSKTHQDLIGTVPPQETIAVAAPASARIANDGNYHFDDLNITIKEHSSGKGGVAYVALNRPEKHNAFNSELIEQITQAFRALEKDDRVKAIVLSGEGPSFSAGGDLKWMQSMAGYSHAENVTDAMKLATMYETIFQCEKPVITRVHGVAMAGGTGLIAASDYAVAEGGTKFQITEVNLGLRPSTISSYLIPKIGEHNARALFTGGEKFYANRAREYGLVDLVVPADRLDRAVDDVVGQALTGGKPVLHLMTSMNSCLENGKPEPVRHALDPASDDDGKQANHNRILDLIDGVSERLNGPRQALMEFTANDIADARVSDYAQGKLREFFVSRSGSARPAAVPASRATL